MDAQDPLQPPVKLETTDVQLLLVRKELVLDEWSNRLEQDDPSELQHIKEEQQELWTSWEGEHLQGLVKTNFTKLTFTSTTVKREEDDDKKPQSSQLHQTNALGTEADGEDYGGPDSDRSSNPDSYLQPVTDEEVSHSSEPETDDSHDWEVNHKPQSSLNPRKNNEGPEYNTKEISFSQKRHPWEHCENKTVVKTFRCSVCGKKYTWQRSLTTHMKLHLEGKSFSCSLCQKTFPFKSHLLMHMRVHTGEKPFSCSFCSSRFTQRSNLATHIKIHKGENLFSCSVCGTKFTQKEHMKKHTRIHTGDKPYSCTLCGSRFTQKGSLRHHLRIHTGEKPFSCNLCERGFTQISNMKKHKCVGDTRGRK